MNPSVAASELDSLLERMVAARQLSASDARGLVTHHGSGNGTAIRSEEEVLQWLAREYELPYSALDDIEPDKEVLSLFPARLLLRDGLLPLRRVNGIIKPEMVEILVAGGPGRNQSRAYMSSHLQGPTTSRRVALPHRWDALIRDQP